MPYGVAPIATASTLYEVVHEPQCGGFGMRATRDMPTGTVVFRERPLACLASAALQELFFTDSVMQSFLDEIVARDEAPYSDRAWWPEPTPTPIKAIQHFAEIEFAKLPLSTQKQWMSLADSFSKAGEKTPGNIMRSNAFTDASTGDNFLYEHLSRANHSCAPNMQRTFEFAGLAVVSLLRDVCRGEPLLISYLSDSDLELPTEERRAMLHEKFGFTCQCERCGSYDSELDATPTPERDDVTRNGSEYFPRSKSEAVRVLDSAQHALSQHLEACTSKMIAQPEAAGAAGSTTPAGAALLEAVRGCSAALVATDRARRALDRD